MSCRTYISRKMLRELHCTAGVVVVSFIPSSKRGGHATLYVDPEAVVYFNSLGLNVTII